MSLFKVREFWSIDLNQLQSHTVSSEGRREFQLPSARPAADGDFIVSPGKFSSIGDQDVFVCADLSGFICIVQVPILEQERLNIQRDAEAGDAPIGSPTQSNSSATPSRDQLDVGNRQLLAVSRLGCPVVDLKCGYFNSALKQSIAVLGFDQLIVFQVKKRQIDLISASFGEDATGADSQTINESLLSHVLEEHYRLDLLPGEFAQSILSIDCHADSRLVGRPAHNHHHLSNTANAGEQLFDAGDDGKPSSGGGGGGAKAFSKGKGKQIIQSLHLPQRDKILVQYTNQFLLTLIDSKKVLSHLQLECSEGANPAAEDPATNAAAEGQAPRADSLNEEQMSRYVGSCPAAHLHVADNCCSVVVSLSDYTIHCLPLSQLMNLAKQSVMQRVARNLMNVGQEGKLIELATIPASDSSQPRRSSLSDSRLSCGAKAQQAPHCVGVDLAAVSLWSWELVMRPLQMAGVQRRAVDTTASSQRSEFSLSQLVVASRYAVDLFSSSGEQLWSHRFETPLMCFSVYTIAKGQSATRAGPTVDGDGQAALEKGPPDKIQFVDKLISLVCTDNLTHNASDLVVMDSDRLVWSALVQCKPSQIMRVKLKKMAGFIALMDVQQSHLNLSYLGTNNKEQNLEDEEDTDAESGSHDDEYISKLEFLDESLAQISGQSKGVQEPDVSAETLNLEKRLKVSVRLEAKSSWPSRRIECCIRLQQSDNSTGVLYNMSAILEFDASLNFEDSNNNWPSKSDQRQQIARGVVEFQLGTCWPDRREPISLSGTFSTSSSPDQHIGAAEIERLDEGETLDGLLGSRGSGSSALPKTLEVRLILKFNDNQTNSFLQEESFLLPLSLIGRLIHIDHTSGQGQDLADVMNNLPQFVQRDSKESKKFVCDSLLCLSESTGLGILAALESIVERDLICRAGGESVASNSQAEDADKRLAILESVDLLAQSPECEFRFKNATGLAREASSEEAAVPVMVSFALRISQSSNSLTNLILSDAAGDSPNPEDVLIWIHLLDLSAPESASTIPAEMLELRRRHWSNNRGVANQAEVGAIHPTGGGNKVLLLSVECNRVVPTLLLHNHLMRRLHLDQLLKSEKFTPSESFVVRNPAELVSKLSAAEANVILINQDFRGALQSILKAHKSALEVKFRSTKEELAREYCKFKISADLSLSLAKRLHNLSDKMQLQYKTLTRLTQQYPNKLGKLLSELEQLKRMDDEFLGLPENKLISIESNQTSTGDNEYSYWPNFERMIK